MTSEELARLLDDTADAINVDNWHNFDYFSGVTPETSEEVLKRKNCRACAMGRLIVLFAERHFPLTVKTDRATFIGQVEREIDAAFVKAVGDEDFSLASAIIEENDNEEAHIVDIQSYLHARAKEVRDA